MREVTYPQNRHGGKLGEEVQGAALTVSPGCSPCWHRARVSAKLIPGRGGRRHDCTSLARRSTTAWLPQTGLLLFGCESSSPAGMLPRALPACLECHGLTAPETPQSRSSPLHSSLSFPPGQEHKAGGKRESRRFCRARGHPRSPREDASCACVLRS